MPAGGRAGGGHGDSALPVERVQRSLRELVVRIELEGALQLLAGLGIQLAGFRDLVRVAA